MNCQRCNKLLNNNSGCIRIIKIIFLFLFKFLFVFYKMAGFQPKAFIKHCDYMTPKYAWEWIKDFKPKDKISWEAIYGDGESGKILTDLGFNVIHEEIDFFTNTVGDVIVSNPPFSKKKEIMARLKEIDKPFIIICPSSMINTQYVH